MGQGTVVNQDYAWRYFEIHSSQRMTLFNYFLIISGVISSGIAAAIQGAQGIAFLGGALGALLSLFSFVFWKLDQRTATLVKLAETVLTSAEEGMEEEFRIFTENNVGLRSKIFDFGPQWTYGKSFRFTFVVMGLVGVVSAVISLLKATGVLTW
ncbi:hypothetical protein [Metapseudomonas resinovorans]|uniref:hypothetical protein n=1 Tax=Metapseudomonas resinovorans TaxID=53412 RepID=UPI0012DE0B16|nr:hypothetical protein [Pseudomonas resinovorans]